MTLNVLERHDSPYFLSPNSIALQADYVTMVEDRHNVRKISYPGPILPLLAKLAHPAARSLCDS